MTTQNEILQRLWKRYEEERDRLPASAREVVEWAVEQGLLDLPDIDPYDILASQMATALREEYATDAKGRKYLVNHAVRVTRSEFKPPFGQSWGSLRANIWRLDSPAGQVWTWPRGPAAGRRRTPKRRELEAGRRVHRG